MSEFYHELTEYDGTVHYIPPEAVETVQRRWDAGQPIHLKKSGVSVAPGQIKSFRRGSRPYGEQPLLEAAAQAFNEPVFNEDGSIVCRWVKKAVPQYQYNKYYAALPAYKRLDDDGATVTVALFLPVHQIDVTKLAYCSDDEVRELEKRRNPRSEA